MPAVVGLWVLYALIELSDLLDGTVARRTNSVSDLGKLLDPFADVVSRLTYFTVMLSFSFMPAWMFVLILYREVGIIFLRMMMLRLGVALAARGGGKAKAVLYAVGGGLGLAQLSALYAGWFGFAAPYLSAVTTVVLGVAVLLAWVSFADYLRLFFQQQRSTAS